MLSSPTTLLGSDCGIRRRPILQFWGQSCVSRKKALETLWNPVIGHIPVPFQGNGPIVLFLTNSMVLSCSLHAVLHDCQDSDRL